MTDLRTLLREGDPLTGEPALTGAHCARIKARIRAEAGAADARVWVGSLLVGASLAAVSVAVFVTAASRPPSTAGRSDDAPVPAVARETRHLQFATPGGTRIIWVFDSQFDVR